MSGKGFITAALSLCGCGAKGESGAPAALPEESSPPVIEVQITPANLYDYFEYKEYPTAIRGENNGEISRVQVSYGLALKEGLSAAKDAQYKHTMWLRFSAEGVVHKGSFTVDFDTLQFTGNIDSTETSQISQELHFWAKGDRTTTWTYGNYGSSYILYLQNFQVTDCGGVIYLENKPAA